MINILYDFMEIKQQQFFPTHLSETWKPIKIYGYFEGAYSQGNRTLAPSADTKKEPLEAVVQHGTKAHGYEGAGDFENQAVFAPSGLSDAE